MWQSLSGQRLIAYWFGAVVVIATAIIAAGIHVERSDALWLLTFSAIPPAVVLLLGRAVTPTVAELLQAVDARKEGTRERRAIGSTTSAPTCLR